jgi:hypothetical protein
MDHSTRTIVKGKSPPSQRSPPKGKRVERYVEDDDDNYIDQSTRTIVKGKSTPSQRSSRGKRTESYAEEDDDYYYEDEGSTSLRTASDRRKRRDRSNATTPSQRRVRYVRPKSTFKVYRIN